MHKYKQMAAYLVFGVLTVVINFACYLLCAKLLHMDYMISNGIAWIAAVIFAFATNKWFVFQKSETSDIASVSKEFAVFVGCRIASGIMDMLIMYVFIDLLHYNDVVIKVVSSAFVIIANYVLSKWIVFRKGETVSEKL
ncbi:GtrA family protein [Paenibacillus piri]|uniref:GtrA family protein n=1 Tax=Paenibacillus piri TaxID=2547395 RepID=A0A4R5KNT5_9BACL|nr:GtrA family protein [Paenibacillus piri]TDF96337.1 GtrA family protein [Paenibacillus piri]